MLRAVLPAGRDARWVLLGTLFSAIGTGLTLPFLLVYLTQVRGLNAGTVGLLTAWMGGVGLALAPVGGTIVDRFGARRVVVPLLLVEALGTASLSLVDSVGTAFAALTVMAVGGAAVWSALSTILATLVSEDDRQRAFGLSFTLLNLGIGTGGLIAGSFVNVAHPGTFQLLYLGDAVSFLVPVAILLSRPHVGRRSPRAPVVPGEPVPRGGYAQVFRDRAFVSYFIFGLVLGTIGYAQIEIGFTAFSIEVAHVPARVIGWAFAGNTLLIVLAQLFVLRWLQGRSRTRALAIVGLIFASSWLILALSGAAGKAGHAWLAAVGVVACSVVFACGETLMSPILPAITNALAPDELRGRYNAVASMAFGLSSVVGPATAGPLIGRGHASAWIAFVIAGSLVASMLALRLHRRLTPAQDGLGAPITVIDSPVVSPVVDSPVVEAVAGA
jgi:MFS family permease